MIEPARTTERAATGSRRVVIAPATDAERAAIYRMRHDVYAHELRQHAVNGRAELQDALDAFNVYITARVEGAVAGFVSITPPGRSYSVDKYFARAAMPFPCDDGLFEIRLLTVSAGFRQRTVAPLLMYAALRWIEAHGGTHVVALGRSEIVELYLGVGMQRTGQAAAASAVAYQLLHADTHRIRAALTGKERLLEWLERRTEWALPMPFAQPPACYHGGAFFDAIGVELDTLERRHDVINADVLDAWFPPSPRVLDALREHLPWLVRTSPPTHCEGMARTIARVRDVAPSNILCGGGSSDLIFLALTRWLTQSSRVLILDPMYGEYAHVLEQVVRCRVDRFELRADDDYTLDADAWVERVRRGRYDLAVIVNPNSPTGRHVPAARLGDALRRVQARVWIDETYVEYAGSGESLERMAAATSHVTVCKSMSKVYALSGMRAAYLCAAAPVIESLRPHCPPWAVGLPAQLAAVQALQDTDYYARRWAETHQLRTALAAGLASLGVTTVPGIANFLLCRLPAHAPEAATVVARARTQGVFLREVGNMGRALDARVLRIAVKDAPANERIVQVLAGAMA